MTRADFFRTNVQDPSVTGQPNSIPTNYLLSAPKEVFTSKSIKKKNIKIINNKKEGTKRSTSHSKTAVTCSGDIAKNMTGESVLRNSTQGKTEVMRVQIPSTGYYKPGYYILLLLLFVIILPRERDGERERGREREERCIFVFPD